MVPSIFYFVQYIPTFFVLFQASHGVEHCFFNTLDKLISYYKVPDRGLTHVLKEPYVREDSISKDSDDTGK